MHHWLRGMDAPAPALVCQGLECYGCVRGQLMGSALLPLNVRLLFFCCYRNYLELMVELPWSKTTTDRLDITQARSTLVLLISCNPHSSPELRNGLSDLIEGCRQRTSFFIVLYCT